jgi:hypothetical protein
LPSIPSGLSAVPGDKQVVLSWQPDPASEGVDFYQVYEGDVAIDLQVAGTSSTVTLDHTGAALVNGLVYSFRVSAHNVTGYGDWSSVVTVAPVGPVPPPPPPANTRYTNIDFSAGKYDGQGVETIFEAYQSDPRLSSWGGTLPALYDQWGMTQDPNQRVHLTHDVSSNWASWQELRTTDGPWSNDSPGLAILAKASLNVSQAATFGPGGFSSGAVRWFAYDYYLPLNVNGVSFQFPTSFSTYAAIHSNGGHADPGFIDLAHYGATYPQYIEFATSPNVNTTPYLTVNLLQLTDASGNRIVSAFNTWHEYVLGIKFAPDNTGWVEVWHDGVQKLAKTFRANIDPSEGGPYVQMQNYTQYPTSFVGGATRSAIVYGGFRAGLTRADVETR